MKYLVLLYDGMADTPVDALGGKTPMEAARKPLLDGLSKDAEVGLVQTVAKNLKPGSDVANLSVLGYDPAAYYTGRSPLEAVSMGIPMGAEDLTLRCNLVTLSGDAPFAAKTMVDYAGGEVTTEEAALLIAAVQSAFGSEEYVYYPGVQYRHCLLWKNAKAQKNAVAPLVPPHDIIGRTVGGYLPKGAAAPLLHMMEHSYAILNNHPVNAKRRAAGKAPANAIWLWGEGTRPGLAPFDKKTGLQGSVISAVDLLKGIGMLAGMRTPEVPGVTGWLDTNYEGKARQAVEEFRSGQDFVYLHFEATDEAGHRGDVNAKVCGIERIDERVLPIVLEYLDSQADYAILVLPDHPTPLALRTHTSAPVPYMLYRKQWQGSGRGVACLGEKSAAGTGIFVGKGHELLGRMLG
ncbi:MAG: cofactor-independent phosphoglycerate mutase [Oscillospiraceae bacterium]|nr:cofactor-independent phosphoglycerate mutase [Oscillospiraceae bacterium]